MFQQWKFAQRRSNYSQLLTTNDRTMPWYFPWPDSIKKRACRYLLQYYLGNFLEEKLTLDQLSIDLFSGTGTVKDVPLDVWAINDALDGLNAPFEVIEGFIASMSVMIPWSGLLSESSHVEIKDLKITVQPKDRSKDSYDLTDMVDSLWGTMNMTSSMQLAKECLKAESVVNEPEVQVQPMEGIELLAKTIETVLLKIKVSLTDTILRIEHVPKDCNTGAELEIHIKRIEYFDESASVGNDTQPQPKCAIQIKTFQLMGVQIYLEEFPIRNRTGSSNTSFVSDSSSPQEFVDGTSSTSPELTPGQNKATAQPCLIGACSGRQELRLRIKQHESVPGPKLELECYLGSFNLFLSPRQLHTIHELANGLLTPVSSDVVPVKRTSKNKLMQACDYQRIETELQRGLEKVEPTRIFKPSFLSLGSEEYISADEEDAKFYSITSNNADMTSSMTSSMSTTISSSSVELPSLAADQGSSGPYFNNPTINTLYSEGLPSQTKSTLTPTNARTFNLQKHKHVFPHRNTTETLVLKMLDDPMAELSKYRLTLSSFSVTLLHEDPLSGGPSDRGGPGDGCPATATTTTTTTTNSLNNISDNFFIELATFNHTGFGGKDFTLMRNRFSAACTKDHLRLVVAPFTIDCTLKTNSKYTTLVADLTLGRVELLECLYEHQNPTTTTAGVTSDNLKPTCTCIELVVFDVKRVDITSLSSMSQSTVEEPCLRVNITHAQRKASMNGQYDGRWQPTTDVKIEAAKFHCELDVSIIDRLTSVLHPQVFKHNMNSSMRTQTLHLLPPQSLGYFATHAMADLDSMNNVGCTNNRIINCQITAQKIKLNIRFPIADLRPASDIDKRPWWERALRDEKLILIFTDIMLSTNIMTNHQKCHQIQMTFSDCEGLYDMSQGMCGVNDCISFLRASHADMDEFSVHDQEAVIKPRVTVTLNQYEGPSVLEDDAASSDEQTPVTSMDDTSYHLNRSGPSPFSSKRVMYESEEMIIPGDPAEMTKFQEQATQHSRVIVDLSIPNLNVSLPSKQIQESLYNRLVNDLFMWEPLAPVPTIDGNVGYMTTTGLDLVSDMLAQSAVTDTFVLAKSAIREESDSDDELDNSMHKNFSMYDPHHNRNMRGHNSIGQTQSLLAFELSVSHGKLTIAQELLDFTGHRLPCCHTEVMFELDKGSIFTVIQYRGQNNLSYLCTQANQLTIYHSPLVGGDFETGGSVQRATCGPPAHLEPVVYLSESGMTGGLSACVGMNGVDSLPMLSLALKISVDPIKSMKEFTLAVGFRSATIRHTVSQYNSAWHSDITKFFSVTDDDILGYIPPAVIIIVNTHLWNCAIDYRPRYLPIRAVVAVDSFSVSSNVSLESPVSVLRFIIEDVTLYISDKCDETHVNLSKNYVCVADMGLFELSLKSTDGSDAKYPKLDLRASNNELHFRTCADSCSALMKLLQYIAHYGDLSATTAADGTQSDQLDYDSDGRLSSLSSKEPVQHNDPGYIGDLMKDAMIEPDRTSNTITCQIPGSGKGHTSRSECSDGSPFSDMFLFPDETEVESDPDLQVFDGQVDDLLAASLLAGGHNSFSVDNNADFDEDDYFIIDDPDYGITSCNGDPVVRLLTEEPLTLIDNHFPPPLGRTDLLKSPDHYPNPVVRYTLSEMSFIWFMYGGHDLGPVYRPPRADKQRQYIPARSASNSPVERVRMSESTLPTSALPHGGRASPVQQRNSREKGGPRRLHDVLMELQLNKVRFQHELYPDDTREASRNVLIIQDVEIRDRLTSSQMNKFLYQYSSETRPKQTHSNMIVVKCVNIKPEPSLKTVECCLHVSVRPLRLNIDQDALFFLRDFFSEIAQSQDTATTTTTTTTSVSDGQSASPVPFNAQCMQQSPASTQNQLQPDDGSISYHRDSQHSSKITSDDPIFFRELTFSPAVPIRLDYHGKFLDLEQGKVIGLLTGLAQLNCSELKLKRICHRQGLLGVDKLIKFIVNEWQNDIKTQLPGILGGVGPMHSFVQIVQGVKDLVWLPIEQYKKDGRIVRGLQRGANSFVTSTAMASIELTNRCVGAIQVIAEVTHDMLSPSPGISPIPRTGSFTKHRLASQPADIREGVTKAYNIVREGIEHTAGNIVSVAREEHDSKGLTGAVGGVLRQIPSTLVRPVIMASEAASNVLVGVRNQILPDARREDIEKWRVESNTHTSSGAQTL